MRAPKIPAKTPETMTVQARRALANAPLQYALSADAALLLALVSALVAAGIGTAVRAGGQRYVRILPVRQALALDLPGTRFDNAVRELAGLHRVWLHWPAETTAEEDAASVLRDGNSYHEITSDGWAGIAGAGAPTVRPAGWLLRATGA